MISSYSNQSKVDLFPFILIYDMPGFLSRGQVQIIQISNWCAMIFTHKHAFSRQIWRTGPIKSNKQDEATMSHAAPAPPGPAPPPAAHPASTQRPKLPGKWTKRHADIILMLSRGHSSNGTVRKGLIDEIKLSLPDVSESQIRRIWKKHKSSIMQGKMPELKRQGAQGKKLGRPFNMSPEEFRARIRDVPFHKRKTLRSLSHATGIPRSTLNDYLRRGILRRRQSSIKPFLTEANRLRRYNWAKSFVESDGKFCDVMGRIMMDEKWFHIQMPKRRCYLLDDEELIERRAKHKSHIEKVMFGCAVARPRQNPATGEWWDGKILLEPFVEYKAAVRNSVHRPAGTIETKAVNVNRAVSRQFIINIIHAAVAQWPDWCERNIEIQQDNATPHPANDDPEIRAVIDFYAVPENGGWRFTLVRQPANSPDTNVLDLAQFRALQAIQQQIQTRNITELVTAVRQAYDEFPLQAAIKVWTTFQLVLDQNYQGEGRQQLQVASHE